MSKERELLKRWTDGLLLNDQIYRKLKKETEELLAEPEQEPVAWIDAGSLKSLQATTGYALRYLTNDTENLNVDDVPLYLAPPKREPLPELIFCVTAYRWGDKEKHSYVVGVFDNLERAIQKAKGETEWRGGKYNCEVISMPLNTTTQNRKHTVEYRIPEYE